MEESDWEELREFAAWYYADRQSKKKPNFYPVPLTPEQKWWDDRAKERFDYAPERDWIGRYLSQYIENFGNSLANVNPQFMSPIFANQQFAGGFKYPQIDFSQMPKYWEYGYRAPNRDPAPKPVTDPDVGNKGGGNAGGAGGIDAISIDPVGGKRLPQVIGIGGQGIGGFTSGSSVKPYNDPTYDGLQPTPAPSPYEPGKGDPLWREGVVIDPKTGQPVKPTTTAPGTTNPGRNTVVGRVFDAFNRFQQEHPNWTSLGVNVILTGLVAMTGLPGAVIARILGPMLTGSGNKTTTPPPSGGWNP